MAEIGDLAVLLASNYIRTLYEDLPVNQLNQPGHPMSRLVVAGIANFFFVGECYILLK